MNFRAHGQRTLRGGPKAHVIVAWGIAPGIESFNASALKGRLIFGHPSACQPLRPTPPATRIIGIIGTPFRAFRVLRVQRQRPASSIPTQTSIPSSLFYSLSSRPHLNYRSCSALLPKCHEHPLTGNGRPPVHPSEVIGALKFPLPLLHALQALHGLPFAKRTLILPQALSLPNGPRPPQNHPPNLSEPPFRPHFAPTTAPSAPSAPSVPSVPFTHPHPNDRNYRSPPRHHKIPHRPQNQPTPLGPISAPLSTASRNLSSSSRRTSFFLPENPHWRLLPGVRRLRSAALRGFTLCRNSLFSCPFSLR
jgi:hypothetical protein